MKVQVNVILDRTYVDVLDLLVAIDTTYGASIDKEQLKRNLLSLDAQGQRWVRDQR